MKVKPIFYLIISLLILLPSCSKKVDKATLENKRLYFNENTVIENVKTYMNLYYPDWELCSEIKAHQLTDSTFNVQYQVINPHFTYSVEKRQIVGEMLFTKDYKQFQLNIIRGVLY